MTWPDAFYVQYDFDAANRMVKARENGATSGVEVLATFAYDDLGRRISLLRGSGSLTSYDYDDADRITDLAHNADGTLQDQTYTFAWSPANQLIERSASNALYKWTEPPDGTVTYAHNGLDRISAFVALGGYDARGNLVADGSRVFGYDLENRLTCAKLGSGTCTNNPTLTLAYDPAGRLRQTNAPGGAGITQFLYDGERLLAEYDDAGTLLRRYVHGPGVDEPLVWYERTGSGTYSRRFLHHDRQGSVIAYSSSGGTIVQVYSYGPWGEPAATGGGPAWGGSRFRYTGQIALPEVQLYHYKARAYDPTLGRFLQTDPIGQEDQINLYAYVGGDPLGNNDPSGKFLDALVDIALITIDVADMAINGVNEENTASLAGNLVGLAIPGATGLGVAARAGARADNAIDAANATRAADNAGDAATAARITCCFVAGTLVDTAEGLKPIETINVGDRVLSRDEATGETAYKPVTDLIQRHQREVWHVRMTVAGPDGDTTAEFGTTDDHPWRTADKRWLRTDELQAGMEILRADGAPARVVSAERTGEVTRTYNLEVADFHTYFVGEQRVWVHNAKNCDVGADANRAASREKGIPDSQIGPSGKPKIHIKDHATRKQADDAAVARGRRGTAPEEHSNPTKGDPHFHPSGSNSREHHSYPRRGFLKNEDY